MFKKNGFTLLEILITIIVLTLGTIALIQAFSTGLLASTDVENVDLALNIGQARMEELRNTPFADLVDSGPTADATFSNFDVTINVAEDTNPMQADVTVVWNAKGGQASVVLTTLVADITSLAAN